MSVWWWVLIWFLLVVAALGVFARIGLSLWRRARLLLSELSTASARFSEITEKLEQVADRTANREPAVFSDPLELRQERYLSKQNAGKRGRKVAEKR